MSDDPRSCPLVWAPWLFAFWLVSGCDGPPPAIAPASTLKGHDKEVVALAFSPDGKSLASRSADAVKVWDLGGRREASSFPSDGSDFAAVAFSPDGKTLAENRPGSGALSWDLASGKERTAYRYPSRPEGWSCYSVSYGWGLAYSPDGMTLAAGGSNQGADGFVTLWDVVTGQGTDIGSYRSPVTTVAYGPDGKTLAAGSLSGSIDLLDIGSRQVKVTIPASRAYLAPVAFSPDGRTLASASDERRIKLWDAATGREVGVLKAHLKGVFCVAFHPGGRVLASGDAGGLIYLWDLRSRRPIARLEGHRGKVWALAFGPDGTTMASAGEDREVRLWDVSAIARDVGP